MTAIDWIFIALLLLSTLVGVSRGFIKEALSLVGWVGSFYIAWKFTDPVLANPSVFTTYLKSKVTMPAVQASIVFVGIFLSSMIVFALINFVICKLVSASPLAGFNRLLGMLFGLLRGAVIILVLVMVVHATPMRSLASWQQSKLVPMAHYYTNVILTTLGALSNGKQTSK